MVSDEEILEWGRKNYPEFANDIKFLRKLWNKIHGKSGSSMNGRSHNKSEYEEVTISEIKEKDNNSRVTIPIAVVTDAKNSRVYEGCSLCRKKKCSHSADRVRYRLQEVEIMDKSGEMKLILISEADKDLVVGVGDKIAVYGIVRETFDGKALYVDWFEKLGNRKAEEAEEGKEESESIVNDKEVKILKLVRSMRTVKKLEKDVFKRFIEGKGYTWEEIEPYVKVVVEDGKEVVVFE